jgi:hypothetical protein
LLTFWLSAAVVVHHTRVAVALVNMFYLTIIT